MKKMGSFTMVINEKVVQELSKSTKPVTDTTLIANIKDPEFNTRFLAEIQNLGYKWVLVCPNTIKNLLEMFEGALNYYGLALYYVGWCHANKKNKYLENGN